MKIRLLRRARRRLLPEHVRADIRDYELIVELMERLLKADSDCVDVGAHRGLFTREMVRIAPRGHHFAWEPLPELAEELAIQFPAVDVHAAALTATNGVASFQRDLNDSGWSGLRARPDRGAHGYRTITVRSERLDDALPSGVQPRFLKIDVEGAEEGVLRGGLETIRKHRPVIVFEHAEDAADLYATRPETLHQLLISELGYEISGLDGAGPYGEAEFAATVRRGERHNFLGVPAEAAGLPDLGEPG